MRVLGVHARALGAGAAISIAFGAGAQELYMLEVEDAPLLSRVDGPTGEVLEQVPIVGATHLGRGLAVRWDGMLFTVDHVTPEDYRLFRFDPETGQGQIIGESMADQAIISLAADPNTGVLYGLDRYNQLFRIDHQTGELTLLGLIDPDGFSWPVLSLAIGRDGMAYVTTMYDIDLYRVDLATLAAQYLCSFGSQWWYEDLAFDAGGEMWAVRLYDGAVLRHDVETCARTMLYDGWSVAGIEVVPEGHGCYADCSGDGGLDLFDFLCFVNTFNAGSDMADCDGSGGLDLFDFLCFVNAFNAGC